MSADRVLSVDLSNALYRACAVTGPLYSRDGLYTGGLFGFLMMVATAAARVKANRLVVCLDQKPYLRSDVYPEYKALRASSKDPELVERVKASRDLVLDALPEIGGTALGIQGFEADDLVAGLLRQYGWRWEALISMSNDDDLYQLLDHPRFSIYKDAKKSVIHGGPDWRSEHGLRADQMVDALALSGTHNEVAGIPGIGPAKSAKALLDPIKHRALLGAHGGIVARNKALIRLPHPELPRLRVPPRPTGFNLRRLYRWAAKYDIEITPVMAAAFEGFHA